MTDAITKLKLNDDILAVVVSAVKTIAHFAEKEAKHNPQVVPAMHRTRHALAELQRQVEEQHEGVWQRLGESEATEDV